MINGHEQLQDTTHPMGGQLQQQQPETRLPAGPAGITALFQKSSPAAGVTKGKNMLAGDMISYTHCSR